MFKNLELQVSYMILFMCYTVILHLVLPILSMLCVCMKGMRERERESKRDREREKYFVTVDSGYCDNVVRRILSIYPVYVQCVLGNDSDIGTKS